MNVETLKQQVAEAETADTYQEIDSEINAHVRARNDEITKRADAEREAVRREVSGVREALMLAVTGVEGLGGVLEDHTLDEVYEATDDIEDGDEAGDIEQRLAEQEQNRRDDQRRDEYDDDIPDFSGIAEAALAIWLRENGQDPVAYFA